MQFAMLAVAVSSKTALSFEDLSNEAKETARRKLRECEHYPYDDWWDSVYEDAKRMGALIGIEIDEINFSGFCSQGDGASFIGRYKHKSDGLEKITEECGGKDATLIRIASELTLMQTTFALQHGFTFEVSIHRTDYRYSHSNTMQTGWEDGDEPYASIPDECAEMDLKVQASLRSFADWIYKQLEAENDYLLSDECVDQHLADLSFDEDGETI